MMLFRATNKVNGMSLPCELVHQTWHVLSPLEKDESDDFDLLKVYVAPPVCVRLGC
jgi:hypothetical protein